MTMIATNMNSHIQKQLSKSLERALEEAHLSGELKLSGRKLKDFPKLNKINPKYHLGDTVCADLSKNRFSELPEEVTEFLFLEKLQLYHNAIRFIPETLSLMQSLSYLDLSRNQLTSLPREICRLPLQILLVAYNRLSALPDELGRITTLAELDVGCNEITNLPPKIGDLSRLKSLDFRCNLLVHLPIELTYLRLVKLDISGNYISTLPNELRKMKSLVDLKLSDNPLTSPPASLCIRGRVHIFKYLERQAAKQERIRNGRIRKNPLDSRGHATLDIRSYRRHNIDNGFSTTDSTDKRWSQEIHSGNHINEARNARRPECSPLSITLPSDVSLNGSFSGTSTPSTISPGGYMSLEDSLSNTGEVHDDLQKRKLERSTSASGADTKKITNPMIYNNSITPPGHLNLSSVNHSLFPNSSSQSIYNTPPQVNGDEKKRGNHTQTYKEYKEALRQQRTCEGLSIYKSKDQSTLSESESQNDSNSSETKDENSSTKNQYNEDSDIPKPIQKTSSLYNNCQYKTVNNSNNSNTSINEHDTSHGKHLEQLPYIKPSSPVTNSSNIFTTNHNSSPKISKVAANYIESNNSFSNYNSSNSKSLAWNSSPEKYTFTMRREFERAKEEADLIEQLRSNIETRLKMALPEDMAPALTDGVVLCHLANHVRPRSVASIHVPSPAVPKLTMARCRRNVDNFLEACRKIGVDEEVLMDADAIMDVGYMNAYGLEVLSHLVSALITNANRRDEDKCEDRNTGLTRTNEDRVLSFILLTAFLFSLVILYFFPVPQ